MIRACPRCASPNVHPLRLSEGLIPGATEIQGTMACPKCAFQGGILEFEDDEAYLAFRAERRGPPGSERSAREAAALAEREAEEEAARTAQEPLPDLEPLLGPDPGPDLIDRLRVVPLMAFAGSVLFVGSGLSALTAVVVQPDALGLVDAAWGVISLLIGVALLAVGKRSWAKTSARPRAGHG